MAGRTNLLHLPSSRCGVDHETRLSPLCYGHEVALAQCDTCGQSFIEEADGSLVPVVAAPRSEDETGWDSQRERALSGDPRWGRLLDGPC